MKFSKTVATLLLSTTLASAGTGLYMVPAASADSVSTTQTEQKIVMSESTQKIASQYVFFDSNSNQYIVDKASLAPKVSGQQLKAVLQQVRATNAQLSEAISASTPVEIYSQGQYIVLNSTQRNIDKYLTNFSYGVTKVTFHWNYARVYLSAGTLRNMGTGLSLGGIWIPNSVVRMVCASLGLVMSRATSGIWFDYNYAIGALVGNYGWQ